jgi:hypothetical protein
MYDLVVETTTDSLHTFRSRPFQVGESRKFRHRANASVGIEIETVYASVRVQTSDSLYSTDSRNFSSSGTDSRSTTRVSTPFAFSKRAVRAACIG